MEIYVDGIIGNDANDGLTPETPVLTTKRADEILNTVIPKNAKETVSYVLTGSFSEENTSTYKAVYWGQPGDEHLIHEHPDEAIEEVLSTYCSEELDLLPVEVTVYGFKRMEPDIEACVDVVLDCLLEYLDEELANPAGDGTKPTDTMKMHARMFVSNILDEYFAWACELNGEQVTVTTSKWVEENCPHWLEGAGVAIEKGL